MAGYVKTWKGLKINIYIITLIFGLIGAVYLSVYDFELYKKENQRKEMSLNEFHDNVDKLHKMERSIERGYYVDTSEGSEYDRLKHPLKYFDSDSIEKSHWQRHSTFFVFSLALSVVLLLVSMTGYKNPKTRNLSIASVVCAAVCILMSAIPLG